MPSGFNFNPGVAPPGNYPYSAYVAVNADLELVRIVLAGDVTLLPPFQEQPVDGRQLEIWVLNGTGGTVNVTIDGGISSALFVASFTLDAGQQTNLLFRYDAVRPTWFLASIPTYF